MISKGEWLSCAFERQENKLIVYLDPEGLVFDGQKYTKQNFSGAEEETFNLKGKPSQKIFKLKDLPADLIEYIYGRKLENLPKEIQNNTIFYLPENNMIWPVGRGGCDSNCNVDAYFYRASRGVVVGKKNSPKV